MRESNGLIAGIHLGCDSASSTGVLDVARASPERVLLTLAVDDVLEAFVDQHPATTLGL